MAISSFRHLPRRASAHDFRCHGTPLRFTLTTSLLPDAATTAAIFARLDGFYAIIAACHYATTLRYHYATLLFIRHH